MISRRKGFGLHKILRGGISQKPHTSRRFSRRRVAYDARGRRTSALRGGASHGPLAGSLDAYGYDALSRLVSVRRTLGGEAVPGFAEDFAYDGAGNRTAWTVRDAAGSLRTTACSADALNRCVLRESPGLVSVRGLADEGATVTVGGCPAARLGAYYFGTADADGGESGAWAEVVAYAVLPHGAADGDDLVAAVTNRVRVPPAHEIPAYDADGNPTLVRTATGDWSVGWDAENRPVRWTDGARTLLMSYDHLGRRVRVVETAGGATNRVVSFLYDGYGCIARTEVGVTDRFVRDPSTGRPLAMLADGRAYLYAHDANGNVAALVDAGTGEVAARYAYAAFGATLIAEGPLARRNPFRFSSEYADDETGLIYYNWRHYDPVHGTWLGRDPIGVDGGANLYAFCGNDPIGRYDVLGQHWMGGFPPSAQQTPSFIDNLYPATVFREENWFRNRFPGWIKYAMEYYQKEVDSNIDCTSTVYDKKTFRINMIPGDVDSGFLWSECFGGNVQEHGDRGMSVYLRDFVLGRFSIDIETPFEIRYGECINGIRKYSWGTNMYVEDYPGLSGKEAWLGPFHRWFPEHRVKRARYKLSGIGECQCCSERK